MNDLKFIQLQKGNQELFENEAFSVVPVGAENAEFVMDVYQENIKILHGNVISLEEWQSILSSNDRDEQNFIICYGTVPIAWLHINGLLNIDMAWISMLVVSSQQHHK